MAAVVELPLHVSERRRVIEGERHRHAPLGLRRGYRYGVRTEKDRGTSPPRLGIRLIDPFLHCVPGDRDDDGSGHRRGVIRAGHGRTGFTAIRRCGQSGGEHQEQGYAQSYQK